MTVMIQSSKKHYVIFLCDVCVYTPLHCRPEPKICHLKSGTCRPAHEHSHQGLVTECRPEPYCVVSFISKRVHVSFKK